MEIIHKQNKLFFNYCFDDHIDRVFYILANPHLYQYTYRNFFSELKCLKGVNMLSSVGSEFQYIWKGLLKCRFRIEEAIDGEHEKLINCYFYDVQGTDFHYHLIYQLNYSTVEEKTILRYQLIFQTVDALNFYHSQFDYKEKLNMFKEMEVFLKQQTFLLEQEESIVTDKGVSIVFGVITNLKLFREYVPLIADSVVYDICNIHKVLFKFVNGYEYNLIVRRCVMENNSGEFILEMVGSKPSSPQHYVIFRVYDLNGKCLVVLRHIFIQPVSVNEFRNLSRKKKRILNMLKKSLLSNNCIK
jgi:hypothetical protein